MSESQLYISMKVIYIHYKSSNFKSGSFPKLLILSTILSNEDPQCRHPTVCSVCSMQFQFILFPIYHGFIYNHWGHVDLIYTIIAVHVHTLTFKELLKTLKNPLLAISYNSWPLTQYLPPPPVSVLRMDPGITHASQVLYNSAS